MHHGAWNAPYGEVHGTQFGRKTGRLRSLPQAGEGAIESLREFHINAIAELAESLAWYAKRNPTAAKRMRKVIEEAAHSLIASPIAVSGRSPATAQILGCGLLLVRRL